MTALFDLDGVILDSEPQYDKFWNAQGEKFELGKNFAAKIKGQTMPRILDKYFANISKEEQDKIVADCIKFESLMVCPLIAGAERFVLDMKLHGAHTALVTSSDNVKLDRIMKRFSMQSWFDAIVTANRVTRSKPDPQGYLLAAKDLKSKIETCIVFEDSFAGIEAGKNAGMGVVALATTNSQQAIQTHAHADLIIDDFKHFSYDDCVNLMNIHK